MVALVAGTTASPWGIPCRGGTFDIGTGAPVPAVPDGAMSAFLQQLQQLGPARLGAVGLVFVILFALLAFLGTNYGAPRMVPLYRDLQTDTAQQIVSQLEDANVPYRLSDEGRTISVPEDLKDRQLLATASVAGPAGATVGYEIFDTRGVLGETTFRQNVTLVRALEGELRRTIRSLQQVRDARVHLVMPRRELFSREEVQPRAAVTLTLDGYGEVNQQTVNAIQQLVAAAVPQLSPTRVAVATSAGQLLARAFDDEESMMAFRAEERRLAQERRLASAIEEMLSRTLGPGKVHAEVSVEMDFDRIATTQERFDPNEQVVRSTVTVDETADSTERERLNTSVETNLPDGGATDDAITSTTSEARTEETTNFEISRVVTNTVRDQGVIQRISAAVMVDGRYDENDVYQPRPDDELGRIETLVRSAIGFDLNRGDTVDVVNLQFVRPEDFEEPVEPPVFLGLTWRELTELMSPLALVIAVIVVMLTVVMPLVKHLMEGGPAPGMAAAHQLLEQQISTPQLAAPPGTLPTLASEFESAMDDELIDIDKVEGRVKASSLRKVGEIVDKHPDEALSIIRNWMYQET